MVAKWLWLQPTKTPQSWPTQTGELRYEQCAPEHPPRRRSTSKVTRKRTVPTRCPPRSCHVTGNRSYHCKRTQPLRYATDERDRPSSDPSRRPSSGSSLLYRKRLLPLDPPAQSLDCQLGHLPNYVNNLGLWAERARIRTSSFTPNAYRTSIARWQTRFWIPEYLSKIIAKTN